MRASSATGPDCALILAGGAGLRLGGQDKPALAAGGRTLLEIALAAVGAVPVVVVGPPRTVPPGVLVVREEPAGAGPAAAVVAGLTALPAPPTAGGRAGSGSVVAVLAADLPGVTPALLADLAGRLRADRVGHGIVAADPSGRPQWLLGVWWLDALRAAAGRRPDWADRPARELLGHLDFRAVTVDARAAADVDTPAALAAWRAAAG